MVNAVTRLLAPIASAFLSACQPGQPEAARPDSLVGEFVESDSLAPRPAEVTAEAVPGFQTAASWSYPGRAAVGVGPLEFHVTLRPSPGDTLTIAVQLVNSGADRLRIEWSTCPVAFRLHAEGERRERPAYDHVREWRRQAAARGILTGCDLNAPGLNLAPGGRTNPREFSAAVPLADSAVRSLAPGSYFAELVLPGVGWHLATAEAQSRTAQDTVRLPLGVFTRAP